MHEYAVFIHPLGHGKGRADYSQIRCGRLITLIEIILFNPLNRLTIRIFVQNHVSSLFQRIKGSHTPI